VLAPGNVFRVSRSAGNYMRINVAMMEEERIYRVLADALA
jgi:DNA-binding transcriptional MocR family regulator